MPSQTRSSSRLRSSAAKKIQKRFRSRKIKIQRQRSKASRKIQSIARAKIQGNQTRKLINRVKTTMLTDNNCPVCLESLDPIDKTNPVATLLPCGHRFHTKCIKDSLPGTRGECPLCRTGVSNIPYQVRRDRIQANRTFGNIPLSQQQQEPLPPSLILDPTQRRQYTIERLQELEAIEQRITEQRQQLPDPPEIPALTFNEALNNEMRASEIVEAMRRHYNEASTNYNYYNRSSINDEFLEQDVTNMFFITSEMLTHARNNMRNAVRIAEQLYNGRLA